MSIKYLFIIVGWHFLRNGFYETLEKLSHRGDIEFLIASHQPEDAIDREWLRFIRSIPQCQIHFFENIGFDWGAYSQAIDALQEQVRSYKYVFFMHDDIEIIDEHVIEAFTKFMEEEHLLVAGNCRNPQNHPFPKTHPQVIEWARLSHWNIELRSERWSTVRGSFFVVNPVIFGKIPRIPFQHGSDAVLGNWSVVVFGGLIADHFGSTTLRTISQQALASPYVIEYHRGIGEDASHKIAENQHAPYLTEEYPLKIHISCVENLSLRGYLKIAPYHQIKADLCSDITQLRFKPNSIYECYLEQSLPLLEKKAAENLLRHLFDSLRENGRLIIECEDLLEVARSIVQYRSNPVGLKQSVSRVYGKSFEAGAGRAYYQWGYTALTLTEMLKNVGFRDIRIEEPLSSKAVRQRGLRIIAVNTSSDAPCQVVDLRKKTLRHSAFVFRAATSKLMRILRAGMHGERRHEP